jgi:hypothetical protein
MSGLPTILELEYETSLNYVLPKCDDPVVCTYDLSNLA